MLRDLNTVLNRSSAMLLADAAGAVALVVMLLVALHFPTLV